MQRNKQKLTPFGLAVHMFCAQNALTKKELAAMLEVPYCSLLEVSVGKRAGHEIIPKTYEFMKAYKSRQECV